MNTQVKDKPKTEDVARPAENKGSVVTLDQGVDQVRVQFTERQDQIEALLPPDIPWDRFINAVAHAVAKNPDLLRADRRSLINAGIEAAQDGLLPDGREGTFNIYNNKVKRKDKDGREKEEWIKFVKWMPMIRGLTKKVLETGKVKEFSTRVVYANDTFEVFLGDDERIVHKMNVTGDRGEIIAVYAILKQTNGGIEREVMTRADLDRVKAVSKATNGPWKDWYDEMGRKSVGRRLLKRIPLTADVDRILERDEAHFVLNAPAARQVDAPPAPRRSDFITGPIDRTAEEAVTGGDESGVGLEEIAVELRLTLTNAKTLDEMRAAWKAAGEAGDLDAMRAAMPEELAAISAIYNTRCADFETTAAGAGENAAGENPAPTATEAADTEQQSDAADEQQQADPTFIDQSIAHLQTLKSVSGITRWYDNTFLEEANARDEVTKEHIAKVNAAKNARLKEVMNPPK
ncbi:recombinase RecT [Parvibaculum sp.]|uniref:recombinase RecT n=1 Tax=Parvibaculum sp. TaxID=2024848 RepID=UPI001D261D15|nr:recombinase RecT [Parvibaculum sp.]MBX3490856.1 recombinase RecT [Parvibaculum sp.]